MLAASTFATDRQRLARAGQRARLPQAAPASDKGRIARPAGPQALPKPVVASQNTLLVRGAKGSQWRITFGDGNRVSTVDLTHYRFYHDIGHRHIELTGVLPDAIGLDFNGGGNLGPFAGVGGINVLWHLRGEQRWYLPEVHVYWGGALNVGWDALKVRPVKAVSVGASVGVSLFLAWATYYDRKGVGHPAKNAWVANGFNWTGYFYSVGVSIPTPWGFSLTGSYFASDLNSVRHLVNQAKRPIDSIVWWGVSLGVSWGLPKSAALPSKLFDASKLVLKSSTLAISRTEYAMIYGNGSDFNTKLHNTPIDGWHGIQTGPTFSDWHIGVNQNNY